ncbi:hypothetical protein [Aquibium oceanicum]|uniref:DUF3102 domain-containing protein n=1 Tax=Aquibium oceanicum TaxID=1670800 RepID=A0A1L3SP53_9HYPH|nr:hypothetical protein [Aquibium oceanicum]APH71115.1 hypothetical protein BSQ44_06830 [Aquibium oceanicum]
MNTGTKSAADLASEAPKILKMLEGIRIDKVKVGEELISIKESLKRGEFDLWCENHLKTPKRTLSDYMWMAKAKKRLAEKNVDFTLFRGTSLVKIANCSTSALNQIVAKAQGKTDLFDAELVARIVNNRKSSKPSRPAKPTTRSATAKSDTISAKVENTPEPNTEEPNDADPYVPQEGEIKPETEESNPHLIRLLVLLDTLDPDDRAEARQCLRDLNLPVPYDEPRAPPMLTYQSQPTSAH